MQFTRTALGAALLASAISGGAYAGNYGNTSDPAQVQPQRQTPSSISTGSPNSTSMPQPSTDVPPNSPDLRDRQALDLNGDGIISPD